MNLRWLCVALAASSALLSSVADAKPPALYPLAKVRSGQKGYGLTTFRGTTPERFEIEVLSVTKNWLPKMDLILFKSDDPKLAIAGIWKGISGSPVYIDDKLACAVSYGFPFNKVTIGGCTPIESMIKDGFTAPRRAERAPGGKMPVQRAAAQRVGGGVGTYEEWLRLAPGNDLNASWAGMGEPRQPWMARAPLPRLPRRPAGADGGLAQGMVASAIPLAMSGFTPAVFAEARAFLAGFPVEPMAGAGTGQSDEGPREFQPGSQISVILARGDVSIAGFGTVTYVDGDRVLAFGHPMMELGEFYAPVGAAEVHTIIPSAVSAFVLSSPMRELGSLVQNRQSTIMASTAIRTPLIPIDIYLEKGSGPGAEKGEFHSELLQNKFLTGPLAGMITMNAVQSFLPDRDDVTVYMESKVWIRGKKPLEFVNYLYAGDGAGSAVSGARGLRVLTPVLFNPFSSLEIERIELRVKLSFDTNFGEIVELRLPTPELTPGAKSYVDVVMTRFDDKKIVERVPFDVPASLAGSIIRVEVAPGDAARLDVAPPRSVDDLLDAFGQLLPGNLFAVTLFTAEEGVAINGKIIRDLPASAADRLYPASSTQKGESYKAIARSVYPAKRVVNGRQSLLVKVSEKP